MPHTAIVGQTGTGKTLLAKSVVRFSATRSVPTIVYDPTGSPGQWPGAKQTNSLDELRELFWFSRHCLVVIDEAADLFEWDVQAGRRMLRRGRHIDQDTKGGGHDVILIAQRWTMLDKSAREQTRRVFAFRQGTSDATELAREWSHEQLRGVSDLPELVCMEATRTQYLGIKKVSIP